MLHLPVHANEPSPERTDTADRTPAGIFSRRYRAITIAALLLVTLAAYENRSITTVLPLVAEDFGALRWFGLASAMPAVTFLVASAAAGAWTDHVGPRRVLIAGLVLVVVAQLMSGLAPGIWVFVVGRALSGMGEGLLDVGLIVLVADLLPDAVRGKLFAAFSTAWILPSLIGPGIAGGIAQLWGWRAAFLVALVLAVPAVLALRPVLAQALGREDRPWSQAERSSVAAAAAVAVGIGVLTWGSAALVSGSRVALVATVGALVLIGIRLAHALPAGTIRLAPGAPANVMLTLLCNGAFAALAGYLPLLLTSVRDEPAVLAGLSLSVTGVFWALGSNVVSRLAIRARATPGTLAATGMGLMTLGALGPLLLALDRVNLAAGMALFALAALGMGVISNVLATEIVTMVDAEEVGRYAAARTVAASVGVAITTALGGAFVARAADSLTAAPVVAIVVVGLVLAAGTTLVGRRLDGAPVG